MRKKLCSVLLIMTLTMLIMSRNSALSAQAADAKIHVGIVLQEGFTEEQALLFTNMLTDRLTNIPNVTIIEQYHLNSIVMEELSRRGDYTIDINTISQAGKLAGLQYVIIGSISELNLRTRFSRAYTIDRTFREARRRPLSAYSRRREDTARNSARFQIEYEVSVRMINVENAEEYFSRYERHTELGTVWGQSSRDASYSLFRRGGRLTSEGGGMEQHLRTDSIRRLTPRLAEALRSELTRVAADESGYIVIYLEHD